MSIITLLCFIKENTPESAFPVDIDKNKLVGHLKEAIKEKNSNDFTGIDARKLKLWKVSIPDDRNDFLNNLILQDQDELPATRIIGDYWIEEPLNKHIHVIVKLPLLSMEEALSCIPPPLIYSLNYVMSKTTTKANGDPPTSVLHWDDFFDKVNRFRFDQQPRFERPRFVMKEIINEKDIQSVLDFNICQTLNYLIGPDCIYSKQQTHTTGIPDFNCHYLVKSLILVVEVKRKHVLRDIDGQTFPEFYQSNEKARVVIQQIYNYMRESQLRYGILTTYDNHWFLRREYTELWISKTLPLQSESPPVLKAYAYLTRQSKENPKSPNHLLIVPVHRNKDSRILQSYSKSSSSSLSNQQLISSTSVYRPPNQQSFNFADFKFKNILGEGRSGKTLLCEFRDNMIALKSVDLSKAPPYVLEEMQKEVEIYKDLADLQGKYIPKLICYGYYGGGMSFVIGMNIVGTTLSKHKITKQQISRAIKGLETIHKRGILHNDIREENVLINYNDNVYLIDFGMTSREDTKKKRKLFEEEHLKYYNLLDRYIV
ncbi:hypothetical protein Glove_335g61 [Diversispora epigaea]|uniref:Protein kinase domain-containing protein n=1 Tax=Diversispora epigaea TaxID=1348612 RepID=A0A397HN51_9GLOM|nr:hypothetical protein Glove_335g61 [Diversispora epigaea]